MEVSREVVSVVSVVRHASGVEDSFSLGRQKESRNVSQIQVCIIVFLLQTKREKERGTKSEEYDRAEI